MKTVLDEIVEETKKEIIIIRKKFEDICESIRTSKVLEGLAEETFDYYTDKIAECDLCLELLSKEE